MSKKNETVILVLSLLITIGLGSAGIWWLTSRKDTNIGGLSPENQIFRQKEHRARFDFYLRAIAIEQCN